MKHDIFFKIDKLEMNEKRAILKDAFAVNTKWWVDKLDCSESWRRQLINMSFPAIMKKFGRGCHFVVIHRQGFEETGEIGFCTLDAQVDYFLWIHTTIEDLYKLAEKYKLEKYGND